MAQCASVCLSLDRCASSSHQSIKVGQMLGPSGGPTPAEPVVVPWDGTASIGSHFVDSTEEGPPLSGKGNILANSA